MPITWLLDTLTHAFTGVGILELIGAFGVAVIILTLIIRGILSPLYHYQIAQSKKTMAQQRMLAPELSALRKKHKGDRQRIMQETQKLYQERNVNQLAQLSGCLPAFLQMPILIALYYAFRQATTAHVFGTSPHFLFIPNLNALPSANEFVHGLPLPVVPYLVVPVMAALTTFVQSKMMQQPPNPAATEQEQQTQQMQRTMVIVMPLFIYYFAIITPAALGLYWFVSNCVSIIQQYLVNGWGGLRRRPVAVGGAPAPDGQGGRRAVRNVTVVARSDRKKRARARR